MKTTKKQFGQFVRESRRIIKKYGLYDYMVNYYCELLNQNNAAEYHINFEGKCIDFILNKKGLLLSPKLCARHEIIEGILLGKLKAMAMNGKVDNSAIQEEVHRITRILEKRFK